jgi:hypothetical protein
VLDDALDPWEWLSGVDGVDPENAGGHHRDVEIHEDLDMTDLPHVMNRDMDLQMAMENDFDEELTVEVNDSAVKTSESESDDSAGTTGSGNSPEEA